MTRLMLTILLFTVGLASSRAQLAAEWLRQNQTQRKYLALQIAALKQYASVARRGYDIVSGGLRTVEQIKRGDLDLHSVFLSSLKHVSPFVRRHEKVLALTGSYLSLVEHCRSMKLRWKRLGGLASWERSALGRAYELFAADVANDILVLADIVTDGWYEMKDAERIRTVDELSARQEERSIWLRLISAEFSRHAATTVHHETAANNLQNLLP